MRMRMKHLKRNLKTKPAATARQVGRLIRRLKEAYARGIITRRIYESNLHLLASHLGRERPI